MACEVCNYYNSIFDNVCRDCILDKYSVITEEYNLFKGTKNMIIQYGDISYNNINKQTKIYWYDICNHDIEYNDNEIIFYKGIPGYKGYYGNGIYIKYIDNFKDIYEGPCIRFLKSKC